MKFTVLQENLTKVLVRATRLLPAKPQTPDQSLVLLVAEKGELVVRVRNPFSSYKASVQGSIEVEGKIAVPAKELSSLISAIQAGKVEFSVEKERLLVKASNFKAHLLSGEWVEYSQSPTGGVSLSVNKDELSELLGMGGLAAGIDESRPAFSSLLFEASETGLQVVSTDGFRLSRAEIGIYKEADGEDSKKKAPIDGGSTKKTPKLTGPERAIVSAKLAREGLKIVLDAAEDQIQIEIGDGAVVVRSGGSEVSIKTLEVEYPNYQAIIPKESTITASFSADEALLAMRGVTALDKASSKQQVVELIVRSKDVRLRSLSSERGDAEATVAAEIVRERGDEEFVISFNAAFIFPILQAMSGEQLEIGFSDPLKPALIHAKPAKHGFLCVVMPFRSSSNS